jgi:diaminopimelate epimerase
MEGAGNDFVVLDSTKEVFSLFPEKIRKLADRHLGVGADQVLVVVRGDGADIELR